MVHRAFHWRNGGVHSLRLPNFQSFFYVFLVATTCPAALPVVCPWRQAVQVKTFPVNGSPVTASTALVPKSSLLIHRFVPTSPTHHYIVLFVRRHPRFKNKTSLNVKLFLLGSFIVNSSIDILVSISFSPSLFSPFCCTNPYCISIITLCIRQNQI